MSSYSGLWISQSILEEKSINPYDKTLLSQIISLTKAGPSRVTNGYLADCAGVTETTVSLAIKRLKKDDWLVVENNKEQGNKRAIYPSLKCLNTLFKYVNKGDRYLIKLFKDLFKNMNDGLYDSYTGYLTILMSLFKEFKTDIIEYIISDNKEDKTTTTNANENFSPSPSTAPAAGGDADFLSSQVLLASSMTQFAGQLVPSTPTTVVIPAASEQLANQADAAVNLQAELDADAQAAQQQEEILLQVTSENSHHPASYVAPNPRTKTAKEWADRLESMRANLLGNTQRREKCIRMYGLREGQRWSKGLLRNEAHLDRIVNHFIDERLEELNEQGFLESTGITMHFNNAIRKYLNLGTESTTWFDPELDAPAHNYQGIPIQQAQQQQRYGHHAPIHFE